MQLIRDKINAAGIKHSSLAEKLRIDKSTFSRYINGKILMPEDKYQQLIAILSKKPL